TSAGDLTLGAAGDFRLQDVTGAAAGSKNNGVGLAFAVNSSSFDTEASLGANSTADAAKALTVSARETLAPVDNTIPMTIPARRAGVLGSGFAGSLTVDELSEQTRAFVDAGARVNTNPPPAGASRSVTVQATDQTTIFDAAGGLSLGKSFGVGAGADVAGLTK